MNAEEFIANIDAPDKLEKSYRENKVEFKKEFNAAYPELKEYKLAEF